MTRRFSRGVVTQTSLVGATQATPSGEASSVTHPSFARDFASNAHRLESARLPTNTTPSPTLAELGPATRSARFTVGCPVISCTAPVVPSMTSMRPELPAGTQSESFASSKAR